MRGPEQIWAEAVRTFERGKRFALATVINVRGSTPREVGAKMIIRDDGQFGTIGGGCGEAEVFRKARVLLEESGGARMTEVDLTGDFDQEQIGTCGGIMEVFIDLWSPAGDAPLARRLAAAAQANHPAALVTLVGAGNPPRGALGARMVLDPDSERAETPLSALNPTAIRQLAERSADAIPALLEVEADGGLKPAGRAADVPRIFVDPISGAQKLIIVGAGHIAVPLAALGSMLGFEVTVIDDRASFANRERFPTADRIIVAPFARAIDSLKLDRHCYVVSVTRGHAFDEEAIAAALRQPAGAFVGMIGSRRRAKAMLERLGAAGVPHTRLDEVHVPLGVDIGAETPEEIAVAIMAEMIRERRTGIRDEFTLGAKIGRLRPSRPR